MMQFEYHGSFAPAGILAFAIFVLTVWSSVRILRRAGYSGWWVLLSFVPVVNVALVWAFALSAWPNQPSETPGPAVSDTDEALWSPGSLRPGDEPGPAAGDSPPALPGNQSDGR